MKEFGDGAKAQVFHDTSMGPRVVDFEIGRGSYEVKTGYKALGKDIVMQIAKDVESMSSEEVASVRWPFYKRPVTNRGGATKPLLDALQRAKIEVIMH